MRIAAPAGREKGGHDHVCVLPANLVLPAFSGTQSLQGAATATFSQTGVAPFLSALVTGFGNGTAIYFYGITAVDASLMVTGSESMRTLVPEPGLDALLLLGLASVLAGRAAWRRRPLPSV